MEPLVNCLSYVALDVKDPARVARDAVEVLGTRVVSEGDGTVLVSSNARHAELVLRPAGDDRMRACGLEAAGASAVDAVQQRCNAAGLIVLTTVPSLPCIERSVTFVTSEGHVFEVHTPMPKDRASRYLGPGVHPKCIDHVNFIAADTARWSEEMSASCGFLLSERTAGHEISWLRAADGRHHTVAAVKGEGGGLHHISWEFNSFDDFKKLGDALAVHSRPLVWGPGRHGAGDNLFLYYIDPAGFMIECIAEMEVIRDMAAPPRVVDPGENLSNWKVVNQWGALPPMQWIRHSSPLVPPLPAA